MALSEHDDVANALTTNRTGHTFNEGILPGRPRRSRCLFNMERPHLQVKCLSVDRVAISEQVSGHLVDPAGLEQLACSPDGRRMIGDIESRIRRRSSLRMINMNSTLNVTVGTAAPDHALR
jgi:hypothetical protein